jgi:disulfide bond formation protein DsbB
MLARLDPLLTTWRWPAFALLASLSMLGAAHAFERFAFMLPCPLCLRQREVYWAIAGMAFAALTLWRIRQNPRFMMTVNVMLGLVFLTGAIVAGFHAGVEYRFWPAPSGCDAKAIDVLNLSLGDLNARQATASCENDPFGGAVLLSMAGWNAIVSIILAAISFRAAGVTFEMGQRQLSPAE